MRLIEELQAVASISSGKQKEYYEYLLSIAVTVKCIDAREILSEGDLRFIKERRFIKIKECYSNAANLSLYLSKAFTYVEGQVLSLGILPIDHGFNKYEDKYIDMTLQFAVGDDITTNEYLVFK